MNKPPGLTAYVLTYNEAGQIKETLESIKWADELIVVDSMSTDGTLEVAKQYGARIITEKFSGFGALRNAALDASSNDWMLSIDADERCTPELAREIRSELEGPRFDAYHIPRKSHFLGKWMRHSGWYPDYRQPQLFNRKNFRYNPDLVHETYTLNGRLGCLKEHALQFPWPTLEVATAKLHRYSTLMAQRYADAGKTHGLWRLLGSPLAMFLKVYVAQQGFRDGRHGLILAVLYANYTFLKYAKLWQIRSRSTLPS